MDAEAETKTKKKNKGWRSKLSNSFLKKKKRASSSTCTETRKVSSSTYPETMGSIGHGGEDAEEDKKGKKSFIFQPRISALADPLEYGRRMGWLTRTQSTTREDKNDQDNNMDRDTSTRSDADVSSRIRTNTPESRSSVSDDNKLTSEESRTEVVGEKKKRYGDRISAFGRQMGWLSTSTGKSSDYNNSDTNTTNLLPAVDESESKAKGEGAKADSLEYHEAYYSELAKNERTSLRTQTATESISQKKCQVVRPSALEFGRKMGWVP